ncbi:MAG: hypothetical protein NWE95_10865 [Candidatus Bathyarchaeota archaeon]|nr:hypothetical protein [Candidatus Bathyarchaeota archaeon]
MNLVTANPVPYPTEPSQEFPVLDIKSPKSGEVYTVTDVDLNFTVTKPESWDRYWMGLPVIGSYSVGVYLDGERIQWFVDPQRSGFPSDTFSINLNGLTRGSHRAEIVIDAFAFYDDPNATRGDYLQNFNNISKTIFFMVNADPPTPSPSMEPTTEAELFSTTIVIATSVPVAVIAIGLLFYSKWRLKKSLKPPIYGINNS